MSREPSFDSTYSEEVYLIMMIITMIMIITSMMIITIMNKMLMIIENYRHGMYLNQGEPETER